MRFPVFIELQGKKVLVAGGGKIAARRIKVLAEFGALVTAAAPQICDEVRSLWEAGRIRWENRPVKREDVEDAFLVIAATDSREANHQVVLWCREAGVSVNAADKKEECDFYFPGIAREGSLIAGVCASGQDHRLAREAAEGIRRLFQAEFKEDSACLQEDKGSTDGR